VPAGELAIRLMAALPDNEATSTLISICSQEEAPRRLRESACAELAGRKQGNDAILTALSKHNDYLAETRAAPLTPLAKAAASATATETNATALLLDHLEDPSTASDDLPAIMQALAKIADASASERITRFVRLYHADAFEPPLAEALGAAVPLLVKLNPSGASGLLTGFVNDPRTDPTLRDAAQKQLAALTKQAQQTGQAEGAAAAEPEKAAESVPAHLTSEHVTHALAPLRDALSQCLRNDSARPREARLTLMIDGGSGKVLSAETLPSSLKGCVEPIARQASLPVTTTGKRETLHYSISH
jgi:outer membrane protein assembly factor BamB